MKGAFKDKGQKGFPLVMIEGNDRKGSRRNSMGGSLRKSRKYIAAAEERKGVKISFEMSNEEEESSHFL